MGEGFGGTAAPLGSGQAVARNNAGHATTAASPGEQLFDRGLLARVMRGDGRAGLPEQMHYDPGERPDRAREAEVAAMVAATKAEARRRWMRKHPGQEPPPARW